MASMPDLTSMSLSLFTGEGEPKGFPPEILGDAMNSKYQCWHCERVLRNPVQSYCGHRLCRDCMLFIVRNNTDPRNPVICKLCQEENETIDEESYLKEEEIFPDNAIRREMLTLSVRCIFPNCSWTGLFKEYVGHMESCQYVTVVCEVCNETVLKTEVLAHNETVHVPGAGLCPLGCSQQVSMEDLASHARDSLVEHMTIIAERINVLERKLWGTMQRPSGTAPAAAESRSVTDRISDLERNVRLHSGSSPAAALALGNTDLPAGTATSDASQTNILLSTTNEKLIIYEGVITVLNREVEKLTLQVEAIERQRLLERELLDSLDRRARSMERLIAMKDATMAELELRVTSMEQTSYDGTLLWRISELQRKRQDAVSGRVTSVYSPPFYTSKTGYKMCARLYLNGDGMGKGTHVSLFFVIMRGNYDPLLKWPFRQKVTLMFIDQNGREHVVDAFRPDPTSSSFKRPTTEMNIASGCPLLMPLTALDSTINAYVKDNTAFIKIIVNCDDLTV